MKKFIDLKVVFLSSILFSVLHWFVYPILPEAYKNQYILDNRHPCHDCYLLPFVEKEVGL